MDLIEIVPCRGQEWVTNGDWSKVDALLKAVQEGERRDLAIRPGPVEAARRTLRRQANRLIDRADRLTSDDIQEDQRRAELMTRVDRLKESWARFEAQEIRDRVRTQPTRYHRQLSMLYAEWQASNGMYFRNKLSLPFIKAEIVPGCFADIDVWVKPHVVRFNKSTLTTASDKALQDVMLHEQIHAAVALAHGPEAAACSEFEGHDFNFAEIANRIARDRGWQDCTPGAGFTARDTAVWPPRSNYR
jgi:hypothetical protein